MKEIVNENIFQDYVQSQVKAVAQKIPYRKKFSNALLQFSDLETARQRAAHIRWKSIEYCDKYLIEFEANVIKQGGKVLWALNAEQAQKEILSVLKNSTLKKIIVSDAPLTKEIALKNFLADAEYDTGTSTTSAVAASVSQASFLIADSGCVVSVAENTNELSPASCIKIIMASVDSILPSLYDLDLILPLFSTYKNGEPFPQCVQLLSPVKKEADAAIDFYILLIDNGRSNIMAQEAQRQAMHCIQCNACDTICPVTQNGGSAKTNFPHPVAAVAMPLYKNFSENYHFAQSSTLCGQCADICPVKIDFKKGILANRKAIVESKSISSREKWFYFLWKKTMLNRSFSNWRGINARRHVMEKIFFSGLPYGKNIPSEKKSFNEQWRERMNI